MSTLQKYLFDLDFDAPAPMPGLHQELPENLDEELLEVIEEPPPPPTFSEAELQLARDQAYEAGRQAGLQEAETMTERMLGMALSTMAHQLHELVAAHALAAEEAVRDGVTVALTVARKLLPEYTRQHGLDEIEAVVHECLSHLDKDVRVTIRVNPEQLEAVREGGQRAADAAAFEGRLIYTADPRVVPGDCRVDWGDGGAERDQTRVWTEIEAVVLRALSNEGASQGEVEEQEGAVGN